MTDKDTIMKEAQKLVDDVTVLAADGDRIAILALSLLSGLQQMLESQERMLDIILKQGEVLRMLVDGAMTTIPMPEEPDYRPEIR